MAGGNGRENMAGEDGGRKRAGGEWRDKMGGRRWREKNGGKICAGTQRRETNLRERREKTYMQKSAQLKPTGSGRLGLGRQKLVGPILADRSL